MNNNRDPMTECYICQFKRDISGDTHVQCTRPDPNIKGNEHGIKKGWFMYPLNFDPAWKENYCRNFGGG